MYNGDDFLIENKGLIPGFQLSFIDIFLFKKLMLKIKVISYYEK